ncbi:hypothetical protein F3J02_01405 [Acinetobacter sp. Tr-809]|uniref:hypothetical protein n=1 Tax=Acinetobacter sp. Tr-809 TaxID=2608324 RepID=UPI0014233BE9|nr:hypothetical protein [Acinetobacter sp. Tr-809]NIE95151.1 hypothetical protein [Acinetobacter sp. Tr-809]
MTFEDFKKLRVQHSICEVIDILEAVEHADEDDWAEIIEAALKKLKFLDMNISANDALKVLKEPQQ